MHKHTPGPWHVDEEDPSSNDVYSRSGQLLATAYEIKDCSHDTGAGNALLIAAAPELLEALEALLDISDFAIGPVDSAIHERAEAAIKKARGE